MVSFLLVLVSTALAVAASLVHTAPTGAVDGAVLGPRISLGDIAEIGGLIGDTADAIGSIAGTAAPTASNAAHATAKATLVAPFLDPMPTALFADVLGVDVLGRTTYALHQDALTVPGGSAVAAFTGKWVEGADHVAYTLAADATTVGFDCDRDGVVSADGCGRRYSSDTDTDCCCYVECPACSQCGSELFGEIHAF
ncbi:hypothetical protein C8R46DRAFT_1230081 [Mycena filopes]|nr:hypothetical protein C8R46DRAFT_1230081 [Mycena filopes]